MPNPRHRMKVFLCRRKPFFYYLGKYANFSLVDKDVQKTRGGVHMNNGSQNSIVAAGGAGILAFDMNNDEQQWDIQNEAFSMPNLPSNQASYLA